MREKRLGLDAPSKEWNDGMPLGDLNDVYFFVQVVHHNGFAAAARALDVPKSTLSRRVQELERRLGARLIQRTSRRFLVTEVGRDFLRHARAMLVEAEAAESIVRSRVAEPNGVVRFTCSVGMAPILAPLLPKFLAAHPKVSLVQHASNRLVNLVEEGFDLALRGHVDALPDSGLIRRELLRTPWVLLASPGYIERAGAPSSPHDLAAHPALLLGVTGTERSWTLRRDGEQVGPVQAEARLRSDDIDTLKAAAVAGLGVVALPLYLCARELAAGALERVLPGWEAGEGIITMLTPSRRGQLPSVRAFMDFLITEFPAVERQAD